ncbi:MAG: ribosome recycling factor [Acidaminococcus sp.]|nr:ribosome recycling factor [Acidaminococcus sp.]MDD7398191.1 ribosome recycling factor [Bacillota bacterium]MDY4559586.1 ribosome recycling factor [Eubacteriales bacterium]MDY5344849.1 ribosome recycling factor [Eubacteriales bacterium]
MGYGIDEVDLIFDSLNEDAEKAYESFRHEINLISAGRANPHILDKIMVNCYGVETPLNQVGNVVVTEARVLTISVWDKNSLKEVEKSILAANLGVTPTNDGKVVRLVFPELTEEKRKLIVKDIKNIGENGKIGIRNARRDAMDELKKLQKDNVITEDDLKDFQKDVDKVIGEYLDKLETSLKKKETEVMSI